MTPNPGRPPPPAALPCRVGGNPNVWSNDFFNNLVGQGWAGQLLTPTNLSNPLLQFQRGGGGGGGAGRRLLQASGAIGTGPTAAVSNAPMRLPSDMVLKQARGGPSACPAWGLQPTW